MNLFFDFLNRMSALLLSVDPDGKEKLATLAGKVLCIEITDGQSTPLLTLYLSPSAEGMTIDSACDSEPNVTLTGSIMAFAKLSTTGLESGVLTDGRVTMRGDAESGQALHKILTQLDIDWEELLSRYIGDTPARKIGNSARHFTAWASHSLHLARINGGEFLQEEKRVLVTNLAMQRFQNSVDALRIDTDRLQQRISRLQKNHHIDSSVRPPPAQSRD